MPTSVLYISLEFINSSRRIKYVIYLTQNSLLNLVSWFKTLNYQIFGYLKGCLTYTCLEMQVISVLNNELLCFTFYLLSANPPPNISAIMPSRLSLYNKVQRTQQVDLIVKKTMKRIKLLNKEMATSVAKLFKTMVYVWHLS